MTREKIIAKIQSKGYWTINIHPSQYQEKLISTRAGVKDIVRQAVVELRGWDYPHISDKEGEPYIVDNGIEKMIDWSNHIEFWRMTQSLNFLHLLALREDWMENLEYRNMWSVGNELQGKKLLGMLGTLYTLVEIFEFSRRLIKQEVIKNSLLIHIKLNDIYERQLYVDAHSRFPFSIPKQARSNKPWQWKKEYQLNDILDGVPKLSLEAYLDLVDLFDWQNPPIDNIKNDIQKFLEGKF